MKKWIAVPIVVVLLAAAVVAYASTVKVVFEAENYNVIVPSMRVAKSALASGGAYLEIPLVRPHGQKEGAPKDEGRAIYRIRIPVSARYQFWGRCEWYDGCGNSFFVKIDDKPPVIMGQDGTYGRWHWVKGPLLSLNAGIHTVIIQNREDGSKIDEALFTNDTIHYVPVRAEKPTPGAVVKSKKH